MNLKRTIYRICFLALSLFYLTSFHKTHQHHTFCFPENDLSFPEVSPEQAKISGGLTKSEFDLVLDEFEAVMQFEVNSVENGAKLVVERLWSNNSVNAYALPNGIYRQVTFFGGLARHPEMTTDALRLIACHEVGHHLAGRPTWPARDPRNPNNFIDGTESWASSEGESDYYASLKCFRHLVIEGEKMNLDIEASDLNNYDNTELQFAKNKCETIFSDSTDQKICLRASLAGLSLGEIFKGFNTNRTISLLTPSKAAVSKLDFRHPEGQCRADTYFQGALCDISYRNRKDKDDPNYNTCHEGTHTVGVRPRCWYKP